MNVLERMVEAVEPGGSVLDLQVIRPNPLVELDGRVVCEIDGEPLFEWADAATAAVDAAIAAGSLADEAADDHDVFTHYPTGDDLVADFEGARRRIPPESMPALAATESPLVIRERCRLRRLRVL